MESIPSLTQMAEQFNVTTITIIVVVVMYTRVIDFIKNKLRNKDKSDGQ